MKITVSKAQMRILRYMLENDGVRNTYIAREKTARKLDKLGLIVIWEERHNRFTYGTDYISGISHLGKAFVKATMFPCTHVREDGTACEAKNNVLMQSTEGKYFCRQHGREAYYAGTKFKAAKFTAEMTYSEEHKDWIEVTK